MNNTSCNPQVDLSSLSDSERLIDLCSIAKEVIEELTDLNKSIFDTSPRNLIERQETILNGFEEMLGWFKTKE